MSTWTECDAPGCSVTERTHPYDWRGVQIRRPREWSPPTENVPDMPAFRYLPVVGGYRTWERASYSGTDPWFHAHSDECLEELLRAMPEGASVIDTSGLSFAAEELLGIIEGRLLASEEEAA